MKIEMSEQDLLIWLKIKAFDTINNTVKNSRTENAFNQIYGITYFIDDIEKEMIKNSENKNGIN